MPVDTQQILAEAEKLGRLVAQHPAIARYRDAHRAAVNDPDANRLLNEFNRQLETLARQEASGMPLTDAQRNQLEALQSQIASHLRIKALHVAQVEYVDLLRRVNQAIQRHVAEASGDGLRATAPTTGPRVVM